MYLLDTNALFDSYKDIPNPGLATFLQSQPTSFFYVSSVTIAEVAYGVKLMPVGKRRTLLEKQLADLQQTFSESILPVTTEIALVYGELQASQVKAGFNDYPLDNLIIATALHHNLSVVTRNEKDFLNRGAKVINPYT